VLTSNPQERLGATQGENSLENPSENPNEERLEHQLVESSAYSFHDLLLNGQRKLIEVRLFISYLLKHFQDHRCFDSAAALTLASLFALVPMLAVLYSILAMIPTLEGVGEHIHQWVFRHLVPSTGAEVQAYLVDFAHQAKRLTTVGVLMLFITALSMLHRIERVFNNIWSVKNPRGGLVSFLRYWAVLSLGPVLLGVGLLVTSYVMSVQIFAETIKFIGIQQWGLAILPFVTSWLSFSLLNWVVPNHRVSIRMAFLGGLVSAIGFECAKRLFGIFVAQFHTYQLVYGAFAVFPLFIIWIYVSWTIVLMGAVVTRALSVYRRPSKGKSPWVFAAFHVLYLFWQARQAGVALKSQEIVQQLGSVSVEDWELLRQLLLSLDWIEVTRDEEYLFVKEFEHLTLNDVLEGLCQVPCWRSMSAMGENGLGPWYGVLKEKFQHLGGYHYTQFSVNLRELFLAT